MRERDEDRVLSDQPHLEKRVDHDARTLPAADAIAELPPPVAAYIRATNRCDLDALLATFADDALVNDELTDHWGKEAIALWAARDIIGERLTLKVVKTVHHHGHSIVTAHVDGKFDKRGLPDPLVLVFYFSSCDGGIVQLIILRNRSGT